MFLGDGFAIEINIYSLDFKISFFLRGSVWFAVHFLLVYIAA
jgi:hypothetical protein